MGEGLLVSPLRAVGVVVHEALHPCLLQLALELPMRLRVVVLEGHLVAALLGRPAVVVMTATGLRLLGAPSNLEPVPGLGARVEMRVPPALGRNEHGARSPVDPDGLVAS